MTTTRENNNNRTVLLERRSERGTVTRTRASQMMGWTLEVETERNNCHHHRLQPKASKKELLPLRQPPWGLDQEGRKSPTAKVPEADDPDRQIVPEWSLPPGSDLGPPVEEPASGELAGEEGDGEVEEGDVRRDPSTSPSDPAVHALLDTARHVHDPDLPSRLMKRLLEYMVDPGSSLLFKKIGRRYPQAPHLHQERIVLLLL
jgi:hypothetical protein